MINKCRTCDSPLEVKPFIVEGFIRGWVCRSCEHFLDNADISQWGRQICPQCENKFFPVEAFMCIPVKFSCDRCWHVFSDPGKYTHEIVRDPNFPGEFTIEEITR